MSKSIPEQLCFHVMMSLYIFYNKYFTWNVASQRFNLFIMSQDVEEKDCSVKALHVLKANELGSCAL